eukprot:TRINITY_DN192_c0_g1_i6.p1 TRINITY_DN192_c0_g1~~TRINITY_DN192_c0_g1_i6.p1  ORF type:complete len:208 (-),score=43.15 TRINITY_DN192_c0_g1_i6:138-761(-)
MFVKNEQGSMQCFTEQGWRDLENDTIEGVVDGGSCCKKSVSVSNAFGLFLTSPEVMQKLQQLQEEQNAALEKKERNQLERLARDEREKPLLTLLQSLGYTPTSSSAVKRTEVEAFMGANALVHPLKHKAKRNQIVNFVLQLIQDNDVSRWKRKVHSLVLTPAPAPILNPGETVVGFPVCFDNGVRPRPLLQAYYSPSCSKRGCGSLS